MSRFTILGASGTVGRRLVTHLRAEGHEVFAPARADEAIWRRPLGHVIYAIGITADFRTRPLDTIEAHVCVLRTVLDRADFESLAYLSSTRVYGAHAGGQQQTGEDTALSVNPNDPSDLYNLSKLTGESLCLHSGRAGTRVVRLSNVVGGEDADSTNFLPSLLREAAAGRIVLRSGLQSAKDYIHIDDVATLLPAIALRGQHRLYNLASGRQVSHAEWVDAISSRTGCMVEVAPDAPRITFPQIEIRRLAAEFHAPGRKALNAVIERLQAPRRPSQFR